MDILNSLTTIEQLTRISLMIGVVSPTLLAILFAYLNYRLDKNMRKFGFSIEDISKWNTKMHDRLVEIEDCINKKELIPFSLEKRLRMTTSNLEKWDKSIATDTRKLVDTWNNAVSANSLLLNISIKGQPTTQESCLSMIDKIKIKVDRLLK